jgi:hypothetical protein
MPTAYTPGLSVSAHTLLRRTRRLPLKGETLVTIGQHVAAGDLVARALLPGTLHTLRAGEKLGVGSDELAKLLQVSVGATVTAGQVLAETHGLFGLGGARVVAPATGTVEYISPVTGRVGIREHPVPLGLTAHVAGTVESLLPGEGAVIVSEGAFVQGIFGVGGEAHGPLRTVAAGPDAAVDETRLGGDCDGCVLLGGATANVSHLRRAAELGAVGLIVGAVSDAVLRAYLGYDIGVAITGHEAVPVTLIITEGFGALAMAERTFQLLDSLQGCEASISGATQIRAGVIRPEVLVPRTGAARDTPSNGGALVPGVRVRLIRDPYFGRFATVVSLPSALQRIETEAHVRVAEVALVGGDTVVVPRANLELVDA